MSTIETVADCIINASPTWIAPDVWAKAPSATVKKLRVGCTITLKVRDPDPGVAPQITLGFNGKTQVTSVSWRQIFADVRDASQTFDFLRTTATAALMVRPRHDAQIGSKKVRSAISCRWTPSANDSLRLIQSQLKMRSFERELVFERTFRQPNAAVAADQQADPS